MPSPLHVMIDDQRAKSGIFYTNQKGHVPPLVTTDFVVQDQGNVSPRFMRSTMYNIPVNADMMKQMSVPFGLVVCPMAEVFEGEQLPPVVDLGEMGPIRCIRCKAYMCPNMQFIDGGRRFHCLLCKATTEVPSEYFQHLDHTGQRVDRFERPELVLGAYEFVATKEYCRDNTFPKPPALIFLIDVSYNNIKSGLVSLICSQMKNFLQHLPKEQGQAKSPMKVGFITYNSVVHFYNVNPNLGQPQMLVVGDTQEMFMPLLEGFLVDPVESETVIDTLMHQIPSMFAETRETETILSPAIQAGLEALKASGCAGKLLVFHSSLPSAEAPGKLKNRDDRKVLGTEKEKTVLAPQNTVYNMLGQDCVAVGCSVDLFVFNNSYIDLATIGQVSRLTGGEIYKYTYFQADYDGERLVSDVESNISRLCAFEAIMRVRTSTGIRPTDFYGHFFMSNTTDIEFASIDPDKAVAIEIKHDDKLSEEEGVYLQAALLYTSISGVRKIRVLNLALKSSSQMVDLYRTCELDTIINFFSKQAIFRLLETPPKTVKESLIARSAQILACYRKNCASPTSAGQLILPECMKLLPLYINCLLKSDAISGGSDMTVDDRWFTMAAVTMMDVPSSVVYFYPRLLALHDMEGDVPSHTRCSSEKMVDNGVYLLENGIYMFLWLGLSVAPEWVMSVFGVPSVSQVDVEKNKLPVLDNPLSEKIRGAISTICESHHRSMRLTIVRQRDKMELVMKHFLVEDRGMDGSSSYVDFLCHMHKEIRSILS
ncbi:hypothetical protein AAG570_006334 [Ranatra chinensis]|uniref:Protein transport protein Sec24C n=1 Tax=Ranatra chinensis TaxID=642074 RepID=A0ABD0YTP2_9HEMI